MNQIHSQRTYGNFDPLPPTDEEKQNKKERHEERQRRINEFVEEKKLVKIESDYFSMDSYYYDNITPQVYKVCNIGGPKPKFELDNDPHILELNSLPIIENYVKKCDWLNINTRLNQDED